MVPRDPPGLSECDKVGVQKQGLASGICSETNQLCDLKEVSTLSRLQFPNIHLSFQVSTLSASLCALKAYF